MTQIRRVVHERETKEGRIGATVILKKYYSNVIPNLGLLTAAMEGAYPPETEATWTMDKLVDEMFYVLCGKGTVAYEDGEKVPVESGSAVYLPASIKYRVEDAQNLQLVMVTGPTWYPQQYQWSRD